MYLLDLQVCLDILRGSSGRVLERLRGHAPTEVGLSSVVKAELLYAARGGSRVSQNLDLLHRFFEPLRTYPFDDRCAEHFGLIAADMARAGEILTPPDLLVAATARAHDLVLVTTAARTFSRVVGLRLEDWSE